MPSGPIFISHSSADAATANRIMAYLEQRGTACWISSRDIPPAGPARWHRRRSPQASSACVVLLSHAANESKAVKRELELASHYDKPFIPIRLDDAEPVAALDYYLRNTQWVDYRNGGERALDRIVETATHASAPIVPPSTSATRGPSGVVRAAVALIVVAVLAGAGWLRWGRASSGGEGASPLKTADLLLGSYHWDGVACGAGPMITRQNDALVFTMPGTPTYRHTVQRATLSTGGYAVRVETRVLEPESSRGQTYVLGATAGAKTLDVISNGHTDTWERCPESR